MNLSSIHTPCVYQSPDKSLILSTGSFYTHTLMIFIFLLATITSFIFDILLEELFSHMAGNNVRTLRAFCGCNQHYHILTSQCWLTAASK